MASSSLSSDTWLVLLLLAAIALAFFKNYATGLPPRPSLAPVARPRELTIGNVPDHTPVRLADAMRLATDTMVPRLAGSARSGLPTPEVARAAIDEVVRRLNANGAGVSATPVAEARQVVDEAGVLAVRVAFLAHDRIRNYSSKLRAVIIASPGGKMYVQSVKFATPYSAIEGGPLPYDSLEDTRALARYQKPHEVLRETDLSPGAKVQY